MSNNYDYEYLIEQRSALLKETATLEALKIMDDMLGLDDDGVTQEDVDKAVEIAEDVEGS